MSRRWWLVEMDAWDRAYLRFLGRIVLPTTAAVLLLLWYLETYRPGLLAHLLHAAA